MAEHQRGMPSMDAPDDSRILLRRKGNDSMKRFINVLFFLAFLVVLCGCDRVSPREIEACSPQQRATVPNWVLECIRNANQSVDDPEDTVVTCERIAWDVLCEWEPGFVRRYTFSGAEDAPQLCTTAQTEEEKNACPRGDPSRSP